MPSFHTAGLYADTGLDGEEIGTLVVVVDRAKNLPNRRTMGKQDPYCAARLGKEAKKTETDRRGGQTPRWDQELRFTVHDSADFHNLKITIFNDDRKSDLIGETTINLDELLKPGGGTKDGWHNLSCKGRYAGELRMEFTFYDTRSHDDRQAYQQQSSEQAASAAPTMLGPRAQAPSVKRRPLPSNPPPPSNQFGSSVHPSQTETFGQPEYSEYDASAPQQHMPQEYDQEPLPEVYNEPARALPSFPQGRHGDVATSGASSASLRANYPPQEQSLQEQYDAQQYGYCDDPYALEHVQSSDKYPVQDEYEEELDHNRYPESSPYGQRPVQQPAYRRYEEQQPPPLMHTHSEPEVYQPYQPFGRDIPHPNHYSQEQPDRQQGAYSYPPPQPHPYQRPLPQPTAPRYPQHQSHQQQRPVPPQPVHSHSAPMIPPVERQYPHTHLFKQPTRPLHMAAGPDDIPEAQPEPRRTSDPYNYPHRPASNQPGQQLPPRDAVKPQAVGRLRTSEGNTSNHAPSRSEPPPQAPKPTPRRSYGGIPLYTTHVAGQEDTQPEPSYQPKLSNSRDPPARGYNPDLPLHKPRAISPTRDTPPETPPQQQPLRPGRKAISPAVPKSEPKPFSAFSPDSFDQLNPQNAARSAPVSPANNSKTTSDGRIIRSDGKAIDPTDHLPGHTWAPEPETKVKKPTVTVNMRRFGPRDAPSSAPPATNATAPPPSSSSSRPRAPSKPLAPTLPTTLNAAVNSPYPPPVPGKVPLSPVRSNIDDYEPGGSMSALHKEISGIDIGPSRRSFLGRKKQNPIDSDY